MYVRGLYVHMTDDRQSLSLVPLRRLHGEKTSLLLTLLTMSLNRCIRMGLFSTMHIPSRLRTRLRDLYRQKRRHAPPFARDRSLSYGLPRPAAIVFTPDVLHADAEIPCSTEDRCLCAACTPTLGYPGSSFPSSTLILQR